MSAEGWVSKFADYTVDTVEGCCRLQRDIDRMQSWAERWQMEFNAEYWVNGSILCSVEEQKDPGVHIHKSLKVATQVVRVIKKAYTVLGFVVAAIQNSGGAAFGVLRTVLVAAL